LIGFSSCQEVGQETIEAVQEEKFEQLDPVGYESKPKVYYTLISKLTAYKKHQLNLSSRPFKANWNAN
jgi:hypothetical protein